MKNIFLLLFTFFVTGVLQAQEITIVYPNTAKRGDQLALQISGTGTHFSQASDITVTIFNSATIITANSVSAISDNMLIAQISIPANTQAGAGGVSVVTDVDGFMYYPGFTITNEAGNIPEIVSASPTSGNKGQTLDLTITGQNTSFSQATQLELYFMSQASPIMVNQITAISDTEIKANITVQLNAVPGRYVMGVFSDNDGYLDYEPGFRVNASETDPRLANLSRNTGNLGETLDLTITGANTSFEQGSGTVMVYFFNSATSIMIEDANVRSSTKIDFTLKIPNDQINKGIYTVVVYDYANMQTLTLDSAFTVLNVGFKELAAGKEVRVFPSPAHERFSISYPGPVNDVSVINTIGQAVLIDTKNVETEGEIHRVDLRNYDLPPGIYYVRFRSGTNQLYGKIFIN